MPEKKVINVTSVVVRSNRVLAAKNQSMLRERSFVGNKNQRMRSGELSRNSDRMTKTAGKLKG